MTWLEKKRFNCFFFFLQETKKEDISKELCFFIWGGGLEVKWVMSPSLNLVGGLLCLWSNNAFVLQNPFSGNGFIYL